MAINPPRSEEEWPDLMRPYMPQMREPSFSTATEIRMKLEHAQMIYNPKLPGFQSMYNELMAKGLLITDELNNLPPLRSESQMSAKQDTMIFVSSDKVRALLVEYEPGTKTEGLVQVKTLDPSICVGDFVVVPTRTRHKYTVVKVKEADVVPNMEPTHECYWIVGKVEMEDYEKLLENERAVVARLLQIQLNASRRALRSEMQLSDEDMKSLEGRLLSGPAATEPVPYDPTKLTE